MPSYPTSGGLLSGLAEGVNTAIQGYAVNQEARQKMQAGLLEHGLMTDETGNVKRTPEAQAAFEQDQAERDPTSDRSARLRNFARASLGAVDPQLAASIDDKTSGYEVKQYLSMARPNISGEYGVQGRQAMANMYGQRMALQRSAQASHVADTFDKDPNLQKLTQQQQGIQRGRHTLDTVPTLTPQLFNEIQMDIANAISGGRAAAVSTQNKVEFTSLENEFKNLQQRLSNKPQDIGSPEVKQYIGSVLDRLDDAYSNNMHARAQQLMKGRAKAFANNPAALEVLQEKVDSYKPQSKGLLPPGGESKGLLPQGGGQNLTPEDQQAIQWAQQNPKDPRAAKILQMHGM